MGCELVAGFLAGLVIAMVTTPVGVSGAVFLLPVQLSVLQVPSPAVSATNLLYNVISVPGALLRYGSAGRSWVPLARRLLAGTVPGVVVGATVRVLVLPGGTVFRVLVAALLLALGSWLLIADGRSGARSERTLSPRTVVTLGFAAGLVGGVYGIGGGSLLAPVLVGCGFLMAQVAPAALLATFVTSCVGSLTYAALALAGRAEATAHWALGLACGLGGLLGGYTGAALQPKVPERALRVGLGALAVALSAAYLVAVLV